MAFTITVFAVGPGMVATPAPARADEGQSWVGTIEQRGSWFDPDLGSIGGSPLSQTLDWSYTYVVTSSDPDATLMKSVTPVEKTGTFIGTEALDPPFDCGSSQPDLVLFREYRWDGASTGELDVRYNINDTGLTTFFLRPGTIDRSGYDRAYDCGGPTHDLAFGEGFQTAGWTFVSGIPSPSPDVLVGTRVLWVADSSTNSFGHEGIETIMWTLRREVCTGADTDGDRLSDCDELDVYGTDPFDPDTDEDGLGDGLEVLDLGTDPKNPDSDDDSIDDFTETNGGSPIDTDGDGIIDALDPDSDNDGKPDSEEGTDDTDGDGVPDWRDAFEICNTKALSSSFSARVVVDRRPDIDLFDFDTVFTYCVESDGRITVNENASMLGLVDIGLDTAVLEALGFEPVYRPEAEFAVASSSQGTGRLVSHGQFDICFDSTTLLDRVGLRDRIVRKLSGPLERIIANALRRGGFTPLAKDRITEFLDTTADQLRAAATIIEERLRGTGVPRWLAAWVEHEAAPRIVEKVDDWQGEYTVFISSLDVTSELLAEDLADQLVDALLERIESATTWCFPVWTPEIHHVITTAGVDAFDVGWANPNLTVLRERLDVTQ